MINRILIYIFISLTIFSCVNEKKEETNKIKSLVDEGEIKDSIRIANFKALYNSLEEPIVDTLNIDTVKKWVRITVLPSFRNPYCIILEKKSNYSYITSKVSNGKYGYNWGNLDFSLTINLPDTVFENINKELNKFNFHNLNNDSTCGGGLDGETWIFELIINGTYHKLKRWEPTKCGNITTTQLGLLGKEIINKSKLFECYSLAKNLNTNQQKWIFKK